MTTCETGSNLLNNPLFGRLEIKYLFTDFLRNALPYHCMEVYSKVSDNRLKITVFDGYRR
jgi:hypothetical protein